MIHGRQDGAGCETGDVVGLRRGERIRVERCCPAGGLTNQTDVIGVVDAGKLVFSGSPRLEHGAAALSEFSGDDLHDHMPVDTLGMAGWSEVIREAR